MKKVIAAAMLCCTAGSALAEGMMGGPEMTFNEGFKGEFSLNLWAIGTDNKLKFKDDSTIFPDNPNLYQGVTALTGSPGLSGDGYVSTRTLLEISDRLFNGTLHLHYDRFSLQLDTSYASVVEGGTAEFDHFLLPNLEGLTIDVNQDTFHFNLNGGYAITPEIDLFAGLRWTRVHVLGEAAADGNYEDAVFIGKGTTAVKSENDWYDPLVGVRIKSNFNEDFYFRFQADIAGLAGVEYAYSGTASVGWRLHEHFNFEGGYRFLKYYANDDDVSFTQQSQGVQGKLVFLF